MIAGYFDWCIHDPYLENDRGDLGSVVQQAQSSGGHALHGSTNVSLLRSRFIA